MWWNVAIKGKPDCPLCSSFQKEVRLFSHLAISPGDNFSRGALPFSQKLLPYLQMNGLDVMITMVCLNFYHSIPCLCSDMSSGLYVKSAWYFVYKVILWSLIFTGPSREALLWPASSTGCLFHFQKCKIVILNPFGVCVCLKGWEGVKWWHQKLGYWVAGLHVCRQLIAPPPTGHWGHSFVPQGSKALWDVVLTPSTLYVFAILLRFMGERTNSKTDYLDVSDKS